MDDKEIAQAKNLIQQISQYAENRVGECKREVVSKLLFFINPSYSLVGLHFIGGEGIIIRALDQVKTPICIKVARTDFQNLRGVSCETGKSKLVDIFTFKKKPKFVGNVEAERFKQGAILHKKLYDEIKKEMVTAMFSVPQVYYISPGPILFYVMEWVDTPLLSTYLIEKNDIIFSLQMFSKLVGAIAFCHDRGIIHRDLKIENVHVGNKNSVVLMDWTLAKEIGDRGVTMVGTKCGSLGYAPGKFIRDGDFKNANYLDDIYSLGMILWAYSTFQKLPLLREADYTPEKEEEYRRYLSGFLPDCIGQIFWKATDIESKRYTNALSIQTDIQTAIDSLAENKTGFYKVEKALTVAPSIDKQISEKVEKIFDLTDYMEELTKCDNCGKCNGTYVCRIISKKVVEIVFKMKEKGII